MLPKDQLRILSIIHSVMGGIFFLIGCIGLIYVLMGAAFVIVPMAGGFEKANGTGIIGLIFGGIGFIFTLIFWVIAGLNIASGLFLSRQTRRQFSFVVGVIDCLIFPFGTVLGVFDLIVLSGAEVRALYGETVPPIYPPAL